MYCSDSERLIGDAAKNQVAMNPVSVLKLQRPRYKTEQDPALQHNTVFDAKRLIGRKFSDAEVQADMKREFQLLNRSQYITHTLR